MTCLKVFLKDYSTLKKNIKGVKFMILIQHSRAATQEHPLRFTSPVAPQIKLAALILLSITFYDYGVVQRGSMEEILEVKQIYLLSGTTPWLMCGRC